MLALEAARAVAAEAKRLFGRYCQRWEVAGSVRRGRPQVHDLDIVCMPIDMKAWMELGMTAKGLHVSGRYVAGPRNLSLVGRWQVPGGSHKVECQVDINSAHELNWGMMLLSKTGSVEHNIWLASRAKKAGMTFSPYQGIMRDGHVIAGATEEEVFKALGLALVPPEQREMRGTRPAWQS